jgi:hypothetical protein
MGPVIAALVGIFPPAAGAKPDATCPTRREGQRFSHGFHRNVEETKLLEIPEAMTADTDCAPLQ